MSYKKGRPIPPEGIEVRRAIRAEADANSAITPQDLRKWFGVQQRVVDSALTRTVAEWESSLGASSSQPRAAPAAPTPSRPPVPTKARETLPFPVPGSQAIKLGLEQGFVKFTRKPARMGIHYIFMIPRAYVKNGSCGERYPLRRRFFF